MDAGMQSFSLEIAQGISVGQAILQIVKIHPILRKYWITDDAELSEHVLVALNGEEIYTKPNGLQTPLADGDTLSFFSPLAGG